MAVRKTINQMARVQKKAENIDERDARLYDRLLTTESKEQTLEFFKQTTSSGRAITNMEQSGQLPQGYNFAVRRIALKIFNLDGTSFFLAGGTAVKWAINAIMAKGYLEVVVDNFTVFNTHLSEFFDQTDYMNNGASTSIGCAVIPAKTRALIKLRKEILLLGQRTFSVKLSCTTPEEAGGYTAANTAIMCMLLGGMSSPK